MKHMNLFNHVITNINFIFIQMLDWLRSRGSSNCVGCYCACKSQSMHFDGKNLIRHQTTQYALCLEIKLLFQL